MGIKVERFGTHAGAAVDAFRLENRRGMRARVMSYGACLVDFEVPDAQGRPADVVLGFDSLASYLDDPAYFGMTCGRMVNRIRNAQFELDGETYEVTRNWRQHQLHGGVNSFSRRTWAAETDATGNAVVFALTSPDGEEGYPGTVRSRTTYALDDGGLTITMEAETDRPTVVNQAHHSYWNLAGHGSGTILEHIVSVAADHYTPGDEDLIPTGTIEAVAGTPYDLRRPRALREHFSELAREGETNGYDGNWCVNGTSGTLRPCATLTDPASGRTARFLTTEPGLQVYTAGWLAQGTRGKKGAVYGPYGGIAFEPQIYPDAPNIPSFPSARLDPGQKRAQVMRVEFD
jgi:aldose 1-epimerase